MEGVKLFEDSVLVNGKMFPLAPEVSATVDTAGNLSRTRRYTATRAALLGPFSLFAPKGVKHDDRELFLIIEGPDWAELVQCNADAQARTRSFAQAINTAARNVHQARQARAQRTAAAHQALVSAGADQSGIHASEVALCGAANERNAIYATATSLSAILRSYPESEGRRVNSAHTILAAAHAALQEEVPIPPRPAPPIGAEQPSLHGGVADPGKEKALRPGASMDTSNQTGEGPGVGASSDIILQIRQLGDLHSGGLISTEEFETTKAALLARLRQ